MAITGTHLFSDSRFFHDGGADSCNDQQVSLYCLQQ
jgi:hypothetical protein